MKPISEQLDHLSVTQPSSSSPRELAPPLWVAVKKLPLFGEAVEAVLDTFSKPPDIGIFQRNMIPAPGPAPLRQGFEFSIMTYNVLAECYMMPTRYAHCPEYARRWSYRGKQMMKEIALYHPDVIVLQEVDHFYDFFEPSLASLGYTGIYAKRSAFRLDGCALFFKASKFELESSLRVDYNDLAELKHDESYRRDNVAIVATLVPTTAATTGASAETRRVIIATTHFFWNPQFEFVKTQQARMLLDKLTTVYKTESITKNAALFIAGDFNSVPTSDVYACFRNNTLNLASAYSSFGEPETHFTSHYYGCLDYIWHTPERAQLLEVLEAVPSTLCEQKCAFPSPVFPSDHLPLMAKFVLFDDTRSDADGADGHT